MPEREDFYTPENVDEEIEALLHAGGSPTRDQRLMRDLSSIHRPLDSEDEHSLEKVLARLLHDNASGHQAKPGSTPLLHQKKEEGRLSFMQHTSLTEQHTRTRQVVWHRLSVLAATLVIVVVVGSLLMILNITHQGQTTSIGGSTLLHATRTATVKRQPGQIVYQSGSYALVNNLAWSPEGNRIAGVTLPVTTTSSEEAATSYTFQSWDALDHQHVLTYKVPGVNFYGATDIAWSADGKRLSIATAKAYYIDAQGNSRPLPSDTKVYVFDAQTTHLLSAFSAPPSSTTGSTTGSTGGGAALLNSTIPLSGGGPAFTSISWSPDNQRLAAAYYGGTNQYAVYIWDTKTDKLVKTLTGFPANIKQVVWSPDGKFLAVSFYNPVGAGAISTLGIWDTTTWKDVKQYNNIQAFSWSPDGKQLALVDATSILGKDVRIVNVLSGQTTRQFSQTEHIEDVSWSPDGSRVAVQYNGLPGKGNVILWDATSGQQLLRFAPEIDHKLSGVYQLSWSPDSKYITCVTTGENSRILVWVAQ